MKELKNKLYETGIIPVIKITDAGQAPALAQALTDGGVFAAEITLRTDAAVESIEKMRLACPDMLIGAGTVLTVEQMHSAVAAGASFIVSPCFNPRTVEAALKENIAMIPGCMTPSEIETAMSYGLDFVKFFPAEAAGGVRMLKAIGAPYANMSFMPTGGITMENAMNYLELTNVLCCGGSFIVPDKELLCGNFNAIRDLAAQSSALVASVRKYESNSAETAKGEAL